MRLLRNILLLLAVVAALVRPAEAGTPYYVPYPNVAAVTCSTDNICSLQPYIVVSNVTVSSVSGVGLYVWQSTCGGTSSDNTYIVPSAGLTGCYHFLSYAGVTGGGGSPVTWPPANDIVISNGTNTPAYLAPSIIGDCVTAQSGGWNLGSCGGGGGGAVSSVFGRTGAVTAQGGATPDYSWALLSGETGWPTTISGYGITDTLTNTVFGRSGTVVATSGDYSYSKISGTLSLAGSVFANQGTTTTLLHGNASGNLSFGAVNLATDVTGILPVASLSSTSVTINGVSCVLSSACTVGFSGTSYRLIASGTTDAAQTSDTTIMWDSSTAASKSETLFACNVGTAGKALVIGDDYGSSSQYSIVITPNGSDTIGTIFSFYSVSSPTVPVSLQCDGAGNWMVGSGGAGGSTIIGSTPGGSSGQLQYNNAGAFGGFTLGGDCTFSKPNITCTKTNGTSFGTLSTLNVGAGLSSGSGVLNASVTSVFGRTGAVVAASNDYTFAQLASTPTTLAGYGITNALSTSLVATDIIVGNASNIATAVALSGDCTLSNAGAITCTKTGGTAFGSFATSTNAANLTGTVPLGQLPTTNAVSGSCTNCNISTDVYGRVTSLANGSGGGGGGWPAVGVTNGTSAAAGNVGEVVENNGAISVAITAGGSYANVQSFTLAAGDYIISGMVQFTAGSIKTASAGTIC